VLLCTVDRTRARRHYRELPGRRRARGHNSLLARGRGSQLNAIAVRQTREASTASAALHNCQSIRLLGSHARVPSQKSREPAPRTRVTLLPRSHASLLSPRSTEADSPELTRACFPRRHRGVIRGHASLLSPRSTETFPEVTRACFPRSHASLLSQKSRESAFPELAPGRFPEVRAWSVPRGCLTWHCS
jgi:hypothetical protein